MVKERGVKIGIYRHERQANEGQGQSYLIDIVDVDMSLSAMLRTNDWKEIINTEVRSKMGAGYDGYIVSAVSVAHGVTELGYVNIVVTVEKIPERFGQRRKPVTRGGQPISGPIKTGKTMSAKQRSNGR